MPNFTAETNIKKHRHKLTQMGAIQKCKKEMLVYWLSFSTLHKILSDPSTFFILRSSK